MRSNYSRVPSGHSPDRGLAQREATTTYVVHQTGSGIVTRAVSGLAGRVGSELCAAVDSVVLDYYTSRASSAHYYIGLDGRIWQLTDELSRVGHVGVTSAERRAYLTGAWARGEVPEVDSVRAVSPRTETLWRSSWPRYDSPQHLFGERSVNDCSIGSKMAPAGIHREAWTPLPGVTTWRDTRHTRAQHLAVAVLAVDIAARYGWPPDWHLDPRGGPRTPYLVGHEDVDLFGCADYGGGWDPGALRVEPRWDWSLVRWAIGELLDSTQNAAEGKIGGGGLSREYDRLFRQIAEPRGIPAGYMRALAKWESSFNAADKSGPAWGLMQVTEVARHDYNNRSGNAPVEPREALLDPRKSVEVCSWILQQIVQAYSELPALAPDWGSEDWLGLLTAGWNAGWSRASGVHYIARRLSEERASVTLANVHASASRFGAVQWLRADIEHPRIGWWRKVARSAVAEIRRDTAPSPRSGATQPSCVADLIRESISHGC